MDKSKVAAMVQETNKAFDKVAAPPGSALERIQEHAGLADRISKLEDAVAKLVAVVDGNHAAHDCVITAVDVLLKDQKTKLGELEKRVDHLAEFSEVQVTGDPNSKALS